MVVATSGISLTAQQHQTQQQQRNELRLENGWGYKVKETEFIQECVRSMRSVVENITQAIQQKKIIIKKMDQ